MAWVLPGSILNADYSTELKKIIKTHLLPRDDNNRWNILGGMENLMNEIDKYEERQVKNLHIPDVSGSINDILDTIHDNLMDKGVDRFNDDDTVKEVGEYKLTFKDVEEELVKYYR